MSAASGNMIDTESRKAELEDILMQYGLGPENLVLVDEFPNEPIRVAKCQKIAKKIFIRKLISPEQKQDVLNDLKRFPEDTSPLEDDWLFLKHTILKYVCSIQQRWQPDYECSKWAMYHMTRV